MMNEWFEFDENYEVIINPIVTTFIPFKNILDKYKDKKLGILELSFICALHHPKTMFNDIRNEEERRKVVLSSMYGVDKLKLDEVTTKAEEFFKELTTTPLTRHLDAALDALEKLTNYYKEVDFEKVDFNGRPLYEAKKLVDTIASSPKVMAAIKELKDLIRKDQEQEGVIRGSGEKSIYEDE